MTTHDDFFEDLYVHTTEPFLTPAMTMAEVKAFVALSEVSKGARVLDLGCGWGRHLEPLTVQGFEPVGVERARSSSQRAARLAPVSRGDVRALPFRDAVFDAVACFYSSLFFFPEPENREALAEVARVLRPGGRLVLQAANPLHLKRLGTEERSIPLADGSRVYERSYFEPASGREIGERRLTRPDGTTLEGRFSIRHYGPGELEALALRVGLELVDLRGDLSLQPWHRRSRELIAVLRRRE